MPTWRVCACTAPACLHCAQRSPPPRHQMPQMLLWLLPPAQRCSQEAGRRTVGMAGRLTGRTCKCSITQATPCKQNLLGGFSSPAHLTPARSSSSSSSSPPANIPTNTLLHKLRTPPAPPTCPPPSPAAAAPHHPPPRAGSSAASPPAAAAGTAGAAAVAVAQPGLAAAGKQLLITDCGQPRCQAAEAPAPATVCWTSTCSPPCWPPPQPVHAAACCAPRGHTYSCNRQPPTTDASSFFQGHHRLP